MEIRPKTASDFYIQRLNCRQILEPLLRRELTRLEHRAIIGEARCVVCLRTRAQVSADLAKALPAPADKNGIPSSAAAAAVDTPLSNCPACHWGWACPDHKEQYVLQDHPKVCLQYQAMNAAQLLAHKYLAASGRLPSWCVTVTALHGCCI